MHPPMESAASLLIKPSGTSLRLCGKREAEAWARKTLTGRDSGSIQPSTTKRLIGGLLDDLLLNYKIKGQSLSWCTIVVEKHLRPYFGTMKVDRLTTTDIEKFIAQRQKEGAKNGTINHGLSLLRRAYNLGRRCTPPKVSHVPFFELLDTSQNVRKGFFEHDQYLSLRAALPEEIRPLLTFAYYTGVRKGEALSLQWHQVDLGERMVRLNPGETKNKEGRILPLAPELWEVLKMQKQIWDERWPECPWVFFRYGQPIRSFRGAWNKACQDAGLWDGDPENERPTRIFHDLRRSGVRNLIRAGVPERVAMMISGHKTRSILDRYNIVSESDIKDAARLLGNYLDSKPEPSSKTEVSTKSRHATNPGVM
jgi:integrase